MKYVDKAAGIFESPSFETVLTQTLSKDINKQLSVKYGDAVQVEVERPGAFNVDIVNSSSLKLEELEQVVYDMLLSTYAASYQTAKMQLALLENVDPTLVEEVNGSAI
jgi:uncharacterized protein YaaN involved in tellurite resistance